jgi:hypothetical protein
LNSCANVEPRGQPAIREIGADRRFRLLSGAARDMTDICECIAEHNPSAADHVRDEILEAIRGLVAFSNQAIDEPILSPVISVFAPFATTSSLMRLTKTRSWLSP